MVNLIAHIEGIEWGIKTPPMAIICKGLKNMERAMGFEPTASTLARLRFTPELLMPALPSL